jgi:ribosome-binding factor A
MASSQRRHDRVSAAIREEVAKFIAEGAKDPRISGFVTVTGADVSGDLKHARVFVSVLGSDTQAASTFAGLKSLASHLRVVVGRNLRLRSAPTIEFVRDDSVARASRIDTLLEEVRNAAVKDGGDSDA